MADFTMQQYLEFTRTTAKYPTDAATVYLTLGLASEAGEVAGKLKKLIRDNNVPVEDYLDEVGDCLWYIARICDEAGITLEQLAQANMEKLQSRLERNVISGDGDKR